MIRYEVVHRFYDRARDCYVDPGAKCPALDADTIERLVRARCLRPAAAGPDSGDADGADDDGLDGLKVAELREIAEKRGLSVANSAKKADIIEALRADAAAGPDSGEE